MKKVEFEFSRQRIMPGFDGKLCKICPSIATDGQTVLMEYQMLLLSGSDVTMGSYIIRSTDGGKTFTEPVAQKKYGRYI